MSSICLSWKEGEAWLHDGPERSTEVDGAGSYTLVVLVDAPTPFS